MSNLAYTDQGKGLAIVFIHGGFVNKSIWEPQLPHFQQNYRVINLDLRGHGESPGVTMKEYSVSDLGSDVINLMDKLQIEKAVFSGLSLGAMVIQWLVANHPDRALGLCLVGAAASLRLTPIERLVTTILFPKPFAMWLFSKTTTRQFLKISFLMTWFMRGSKWLGNQETRKRIKECIGQIEREEIKKIYASFHDFRIQPLKASLFPSIIINGEYDSPIIHLHGKYLKKKLNSNAFLKLKGCGHACNFDSPEEFNAILSQWLSEHVVTEHTLQKDQTLLN